MLKEWSEELARRQEEVIKTLEFEHVRIETMTVFTIGAEAFVMGMQVVEGEHRKADMTVDLNKKHFAVLEECLEPCRSDALYFFSR